MEGDETACLMKVNVGTGLDGDCFLIMIGSEKLTRPPPFVPRVPFFFAAAAFLAGGAFFTAAGFWTEFFLVGAFFFASPAAAFVCLPPPFPRLLVGVGLAGAVTSACMGV